MRCVCVQCMAFPFQDVYQAEGSNLEERRQNWRWHVGALVSAIDTLCQLHCGSKMQQQRVFQRSWKGDENLVWLDTMLLNFWGGKGQDYT